MLLTQIIKRLDKHCFNLVIWQDGKVVYNNLCEGREMKRRKDAEIHFKKFKKNDSQH